MRAKRKRATPGILRVSVTDFGPISSAEIEMRPLIIFTGRNNTGKSHAAMLIHSMLAAEGEAFPARGAGDEFGDVFEGAVTGIFGSDPRGLVRRGRRSARITAGGPGGISISISDRITARRGKRCRRSRLEGAPASSYLASGRAVPPPGRGRFYDLASVIESEMLGGSITAAGGFPRIRYGTGRTVPLHRAPPAAADLAPMLLHLKHAAEPGSLVIIEEPEAHLHVTGQALLAKHITRMVRAGLFVLLVTHSYVLVEEIGTHVKAGAAGPAIRKRLGFGPGDHLGIDEVAPYAFKRSRGSGCRAERIKVDAVEGIPQAEFVEVLGEMYDRSMDLDAAIERAGGGRIGAGEARRGS
ncbi:MAG: AAA family ATPase [Nitrosopumilus sp.]|nr:AAA family ATPase [Nitrosopumilus sp.]